VHILSDILIVATPRLKSRASLAYIPMSGPRSIGTRHPVCVYHKSTNSDRHAQTGCEFVAATTQIAVRKTKLVDAKASVNASFAKSTAGFPSNKRPPEGGLSSPMVHFLAWHSAITFVRR
jgi:hypothetical protein